MLRDGHDMLLETILLLRDRHLGQKRHTKTCKENKIPSCFHQKYNIEQTPYDNIMQMEFTLKTTNILKHQTIMLPERPVIMGKIF